MLQIALIVSQLPEKAHCVPSTMMASQTEAAACGLIFRSRLLTASALTATALYHLIVREDHPLCMSQLTARSEVVRPIGITGFTARL